MHALGQVARRLQLATGSHGDGIRSAASVLRLLPDATPPTGPDREQQRELHGGRAEEPQCAAANVPLSPAGLRALLHSTSSLRRGGVGEDVAASASMALRSATRCAAATGRPYSGAAARAADGGAAWPVQPLSRSPAAARRYSGGAAFVTEHGGGTFRTTGGGSSHSPPHSASG